MEERNDIEKVENSVQTELDVELLPSKETEKTIESIKSVESVETEKTEETVLTTTENTESKDIALDTEIKAEETPEEVISQEEIEKDDTSDVFITESDTFDIRISYFKTDGDFCVEGVDDEFDPKNPAVKHVDITFKYPSQGDYETILAQNAYKTPDKMTLIDVLQMELTRLVVLIRKWSLKAEFSRMVELDTKIVKAISNKVREKIGIRGIM